MTRKRGTASGDVAGKLSSIQDQGDSAGIFEISIRGDHIVIEIVGKNILTRVAGVETKLMSLAENIER